MSRIMSGVFVAVFIFTVIFGMVEMFFERIGVTDPFFRLVVNAAITTAAVYYASKTEKN